MNVLVIGGSRFVGPYIINELINHKHDVSVFNRGTAKQKYAESVTFVKGDRNVDLGKINGEFDVVIDTCAYEGAHTLQVIDKIKFKFLLHFSTVAAYQKKHMFPITEDDAIGKWELWSDYNIGKVQCEEVLAASIINYGIIRPTYILGSQNYLDREAFIYQRLLMKLPIILPGNGQAMVQFVFVQDVAKSIVAMAEQQARGAFNCVGDEIITLEGLVREMGEISKQEPIIEYNFKTDGIKHNEKEFPFANESFICSNDKIKELGIEFTPLLAGLKRDYLSDYKSLK
ncbi:MAG: NAD-dependent epimerase/dehydratase family protein [bacterium]|nr:NAD-dependent epimerase/dehydratase family protein [bacterium]